MSLHRNDRMEAKKSLKILLIEDSENDAHLLAREIRRLGYEAQIQRVETAEALQSKLKNGSWDVILCDYSLPHFDAPHALEIVRESGLDLPFIIISGTIGEESAVSALKAGAHDFIIKGKYARLGPALEREIREAQVRRERSKAEEQLRESEHLLSEAQRIGRIGSWTLDIASETIQPSDEWYRLFNVSRETFEHNTKAYLDLIYGEDRPTVSEWLDEIRAGRHIPDIEYRIFGANGELRYIQCKGILVFDEGGLPKRFVGTAQDITERKLSELQIRQQISRLTTLRIIDQAITSTFDLTFTLDTIVTQVMTQLQVDATGILLPHASGSDLEYRSTRGFFHQFDEQIDINMDHTPARRAVEERRLIRIENLKDEREVTSLLAAEGFVSYFAAPLLAREKVLGVLEVFHRTLFHPTREWIDFLETLAGQTAIAIDNALLLENLQRANAELRQSYDATIEGWSRALDLRDRETEGHTRRVTDMAVGLARMMGIKEEKLIHARRGGLLHDIGKLGVPDNVLLKPGPLNEREWKIMRLHPQFAYEWLSKVPYLREALDIPYCHHEKWDGTGYPQGLKGESIPLTSRIFAIADVWDAITSDRPYRRAWSRERAVEYIRMNSGLHFDPSVVDVFLNNITALLPNHT